MFKYHTRSTGRTPYEEMTGHRVKHNVAVSGEHVHFKVATDTVQDKYEGERSKGYFVGVITRSSEYLIMQGGMVYKCPTMRRHPQAEAYSSECLKDMRADHYEYI